MMRFIYALLLILTLAACKPEPNPGTVETPSADFKVVSLVKDLEHPWALAFLPAGDMLITERPGRLLLVRGASHAIEQVRGLPAIAAKGQGGLLDVIMHPDYARNRLIYFSYAGADDEGLLGTEVARARLNGLRLENLQVIFKAKPKTSGGQHFGSRLVFGPDGKLYISLGERGRMEQAQDPSNHLGGLIRLNEDGSIPEDNPFVGREGFRPELYSYGHRNVQGMARRPGTGDIWLHEHGPRGGDEVNIVKKGANYGWPEITYGIDYTGFKITDKTHAPGMEQPVVYWDPSIAPSGMAFYTGDKFPAWRGDLFVGALVQTHLRRLELKGDEVVAQEVLLEDLGERIRDVREGPDGYLYALTDSPYGQLLRLEPK